MEIDVSALRRERHRTEHFDFVVTERALDYRGDRFAITAPASVHAKVSNTGKALRAEVSAHLDVSCTCDRCLAPVPMGVDVRYAEEYLTPSQAAELGVDPEQGEDDGTVRRVVYRGDAISLDEGFWQSVILELPMKHLCRPDCRGICPRCGQNWNEGQCACGADHIDPRLADLARWRGSEDVGG